MAKLIGTKNDDTINGTSGRDIIYGLEGADIIFGGDGNDIIYGDDKQYHYGAKSDSLYGGKGADSIYGGYGDDGLSGQEGNDRLFGGDGNDDLHGGPGNDTLTGGAGKDLFSFGNSNNTKELIGSDTIMDFQKGDIINLQAIDANGHSYDGDNRFTLLKGGDFYAEGQAVFIPSTHYLLLNTDSNFQTAEIMIKVLGTDSLVQSDFWL